MKNTTNLLSILLLAIFCTAIAFGQTGTGAGIGSTGGTVFRGLKNKPYSAGSIRENIKTLADGNTITETVEGLEYRDGEGRTRREEVGKSNPPYSFTAISILDPVAGYTYSLIPQDKTVFRIKFLSPSRASVYPLTPPPGQTSSSESLGSRVIEGFETVGTRITTVIAPGTIGNEKEIRRVYENWYSQDSRLTLLTISDDPRYGKTTTRLVNIKRDEPDKSLFEIPADYKIIDREPLLPPTAAPPANSNPTENKKP